MVSGIKEADAYWGQGKMETELKLWVWDRDRGNWREVHAEKAADKEISFVSRCSQTLGSSTFSPITCTLHTTPAPGLGGAAAHSAAGRQTGRSGGGSSLQGECSPRFSELGQGGKGRTDGPSAGSGRRDEFKGGGAMAWTLSILS